jgi:lipopolysaccharide export LptBFGC system permease protein LptF
MILIQRYIFKEMVYNFLFTFVVITMIMLLATAVQVIFQFPAIGFFMVLKHLPIMMAASLTIVIPAAALVATVMTYGRIASDNEIITMRASGIHVLRILVPGIIFGLAASLALLIVNDRMVPMAKYRMRSIGDMLDLSAILEATLKQGENMVTLPSGVVMSWDASSKEEKPDGDEAPSLEDWRFTGIRVKMYEDDELKMEALAEVGKIKVQKGGKHAIHLLNVKVTHGQQGSTKEIILPLDDFISGRGRSSKVRPNMRTLSALSAIKGRKVKTYQDHEVDTELHKRISDSLSPLVFVFLSLPVAILFKQQNRMVAFLISTLLAMFVYYPITLLTDTFAKNGTIDPVLAIWPANIVLMILGFLFIMKVMRR